IPKATTHSCRYVGPPKIVAIGIERRSSADPTSVAMSIGRRGSRSTQAPAGRLKSRNGACPTQASTPISYAVFCLKKKQIRVSANIVISEPTSEMLSAVQSFAKFVRSGFLVIDSGRLTTLLLFDRLLESYS